MRVYLQPTGWSSVRATECLNFVKKVCEHENLLVSELELREFDIEIAQEGSFSWSTVCLIYTTSCELADKIRLVCNNWDLQFSCSSLSPTEILEKLKKHIQDAFPYMDILSGEIEDMLCIDTSSDEIDRHLLAEKLSN